MRNFIAVAFITAISFHASCADDLCTTLQSFANSNVSSNKKVVELNTRWGGGLYAPGCKDDESVEGQALCRYLRAHSSSEYPQDNLNRVLFCLSGEQRHAPTGFMEELVHVIYHGVAVPGVRKGISIDVELIRSEDAILRISVRKIDE